MLRSRFFWRLFGGYAAAVVVAVGVLLAVNGDRLRRDTLDDIDRSLRVHALLLRELAAPQLASASPAALQSRIVSLGAATDIRFTVLRADGVVVADSDEDPAQMDNHGSRPEVLAARDAGEGAATRFSRTVAATLRYHAVRVDDGPTTIGYVRAALPLTILEARLADLRRVVALGALAAVALALLVAAALARRLTAPLASMTAIAESIADGAYGSRVDSTAVGDEIDQLAGAFNRMAGELERRVETIEQDRAKLRTILGGMVEGVIAVDAERRLLHLNAAAARMLDVDPVESLGRPIWEVTRVRQIGEVLERALIDADDVTAELTLPVDSQERTVELHASPLRDGDGGPVGAVLVLHDVTELRHLETVRRDFVANVSHELKTPITAIRGLVETIVEDDEMPIDTRTRFLGKIQNQSMRLSLLVTDLLTLARLESAGALAGRETLDLRAPVTASVGNFRSEAEERGIALTPSLPDRPVTVPGDAESLELVVNNLLDNALKYTPPGGEVAVTVREHGAAVQIEVRDTGVGIAPEHHDRIFERFYRVDKARARELGGTGLGLSIVKHVTKIHGGTVAVHSTLGNGSTFTVSLPAASESG